MLPGIYNCVRRRGGAEKERQKLAYSLYILQRIRTVEGETPKNAIQEQTGVIHIMDNSLSRNMLLYRAGEAAVCPEDPSRPRPAQVHQNADSASHPLEACPAKP